MSDGAIQWVYVPIMIGGVFIIMFGYCILRLYKKSEEKNRLVFIIKKLASKNNKFQDELHSSPARS